MDAKDLITPGVTIAGFFVANFLAEDYKRFRSGSSIAAGIAGELEAYRWQAGTIIPVIDRWIAAIDVGVPTEIKFRGHPTMLVERLYEANVADLGLMGVELVRDTVRLYSMIGIYRDTYLVIREDCEVMPPKELLNRLRFARKTIDEALDIGVPLIQALHHRADRWWLIHRLAPLAWWRTRTRSRAGLTASHPHG